MQGVSVVVGKDKIDWGWPVRKAPLALLGLLALTALLPVSAQAANTDPIAVPTMATIFKGKLIDRIPGPPATRPGVTLRPTGVSIPSTGASHRRILLAPPIGATSSGPAKKASS